MKERKSNSKQMSRTHDSHPQSSKQLVNFDGCSRNKSFNSIVKNVEGNILQMNFMFDTENGFTWAGDRLDFSKTIKKQMPVDAETQARCHTIPYDAIKDRIEAELNCMYKAIKDLATVDSSTLEPNFKNIILLAGTIYGTTELTKDFIEVLHGLYNFMTHKKFTEAAGAATYMLSVLNNAQSNLRVGDRVTNSSIGDNLDIPESSVTALTLPPGTKVTKDLFNGFELPEEMNVVCVTDTELAHKLIFAIKASIVLKPLTTGDTVISSDSLGLRRSSLPPGRRFAIQLNSSPPYYFIRE